MSVTLLFPGQGAQTVGMGAELVERSSIAADIYTEASQVLGYDMLALSSSGPAEELNKTEFSQPALFVHSYAALKVLEKERPELWSEIKFVAGLSLGEYTAVAAAGGIEFADGLRLVQARGRAMQAAADAVQSGMSSVLGLEQTCLETLCNEASTDDSFVQVANLLCPGNIAVSGHIVALDRLEPLAQEAGAMRTIRLQVAGAFHTELMRPAVAELAAALEAVTFKATRVPVVSNVDAKPHSSPEEFSALLARQVVSPVLWEASLRNVLDEEMQFIEVGTGRVLAGTLKRIQRKAKCESYG